MAGVACWFMVIEFYSLSHRGLIDDAKTLPKWGSYCVVVADLKSNALRARKTAAFCRAVRLALKRLSMTQAEFSRQLGKSNRWTRDSLIRDKQVAVRSAQAIAKHLILIRVFSKHTEEDFATRALLRNLANPPEATPRPVPLLLFRADEGAIADALSEYLASVGHSVPAKVFRKNPLADCHPRKA